MDNASNWNDVAAHIDRHDSGCWTWSGGLVDCNIYRFIAEMHGSPLPTRKLYRMPDCTLGKECVNPNHLGTGADFVLALNGRRQEIPEPPRAGIEVRLTERDREFLRSVKISWG